MKTTEIFAIGTKVKVKNDTKNFMLNAGQIVEITKHVKWGNGIGYECNNETGIYLNEDFSKLISKP